MKDKDKCGIAHFGQFRLDISALDHSDLGELMTQIGKRMDFLEGLEEQKMDLDQKQMKRQIEGNLDDDFPDEEEYEKPKKNKVSHCTSNPLTPQLTTQNRYVLLTQNDDPANPTTSNDSTQQAPPAAPNNQNNTSNKEKTVETVNQHIKYTSQAYKGDMPNNTPIIIHNKNNWITLKKNLQKEGIDWTNATTVSQGIKVKPSTANDYRALYKYLKEKKIDFHSHQTNEDKHLKIVVKGIPTEISTEDIKTELTEMEFPPISVTRMLGRGKVPIQAIIVELDKAYKPFYNIKEIFGLTVNIEAYKRNGRLIQCHKCQAWGHIQKYCNTTDKCMRCAGEHPSYQCPKPKTIRATCANCGGEHTAMSIDCPKRPKPVTKSTTWKMEKITNATLTKSIPEIQREERNLRRQSQANQDTKQTERNPNASPNSKKSQLTQQLSNLMINFLKTNPTPEQIELLNQSIVAILSSC